MEKTLEYLTALIRSAVTGDSVEFSDDIGAQFKSIIRLARLHEVQHLAASAMLNNGLLKDENDIATAKRLVYEASYRDAKNTHAYELALETLNNAQIPFVPLKGIIVRPFYPESWMRTSCDVDILVHKSDFKKAVSQFKNIGFVADGDINYHDISLLYDDSNLELHFSICENIKKLDAVLSKVWDNVEKADGYRYLQTNDYFVFHHIAHMAYHFLAGGCGIRPFVDLWVLRRAKFFNEDKVIEFCKSAKIYDFYMVVSRLTSVWFEGKKHDDITLKLEKYTLTGGAYGYYPNNAAALTVRNGGKVRYILSMAFPSYGNMRALYPKLNKAPVLLPFYYCYRIFEKTVGKNSKKAKKRYSIVKHQDSEFIKEVASLIRALKLDK